MWLTLIHSHMRLTVCVGDFGYARILSESGATGVTVEDIGPVRWLAPEALVKRAYSTATDVWAFGVVLYEMVLVRGCLGTVCAGC